MSQIHWAEPMAPEGAVGMVTRGTEFALSLVTAGLPRGTGVPDMANGYDEPSPVVPVAVVSEGAFCAPRTDDGEPGGSVQLAWVFTGGRWVLWSGPIRWVPP